jgi:TonB family protein
MKARAFHLLLFAAGCASTSPRPMASPPAERAAPQETPSATDVVRRMDPSEPATTAFLAAIHRRLHQFWGFGFLEDVETRAKNGDTQYQDMNLRVQLEFTLDRTGTLGGIYLRDSSGMLAFDVAAILVVLDADTFPVPPEQLRSPDGLTRVAWTFHRDQRQCSVKGASTYHVLNLLAWDRSRGPKGKEWDEVVEVVRAIREQRRKERANSPRRDLGISDSPPDDRVPDGAR